jgi:hypothetical protein
LTTLNLRARAACVVLAVGGSAWPARAVLLRVWRAAVVAQP